MEEKKTRGRRKKIIDGYASNIVLQEETPVVKVKDEPVVVQSKTIFKGPESYTVQFKKDKTMKVWKFCKTNAFRVEAKDAEEIEFAESKGFQKV